MLKTLELCLMRNHLRTYECSHLWSAVVVVYPSESLLHLSFELPPKKQLMFTLSDVSHRLGGGGAGTGSAGVGRRKEDHKLWSCSRLVVRIRDHLHLLSSSRSHPSRQERTKGKLLSWSHFMVGMRNRFYLHLLHHGMLQHYHCFDLMNVRIERKGPFFTSGQRSENNPWSCFPVTSHRGCDQYVCYPRPGQLINRSQLLCWKTSYHHIRAVYLLWSISTKDLHLSAFGCPEDQFRERHWRISKHQLPYSKTINPCTYPQNMDLKEKEYRS